jgi:hypothetical protein
MMPEFITEEVRQVREFDYPEIKPIPSEESDSFVGGNNDDEADDDE